MGLHSFQMFFYIPLECWFTHMVNNLMKCCQVRYYSGMTAKHQQNLILTIVFYSKQVTACSSKLLQLLVSKDISVWTVKAKEAGIDSHPSERSWGYILSERNVNFELCGPKNNLHFQRLFGLQVHLVWTWCVQRKEKIDGWVVWSTNSFSYILVFNNIL